MFNPGVFCLWFSGPLIFESDEEERVEKRTVRCVTGKGDDLNKCLNHGSFL